MSNTEGGLARSIRRHRTALLGILLMMVVAGVLLAFLPLERDMDEEPEAADPAEASATVGMPQESVAPETGDGTAGDAQDATQGNAPDADSGTAGEADSAASGAGDEAQEPAENDTDATQ